MKKLGQSTRLLAVLLMLSGIGATFKGCVYNPAQKDFLTTDGTVQLQGTITEFNDAGKFVKNYPGQVRLKRNGTYLSAWQNTDGTVWDYPSVALVNGVNTLNGDVRFQNASGVWINGQIPSLLIERKTDLSARGDQKVFLDWSDTKVDTLIKDMAQKTLDKTFTAAELNTFVSDVKNRVVTFFNAAYSGTSVTLVAAAGTDIHTIKFDGADRCDYYGQSPIDYKNQTKTQTSNIYVGTFHCVVVDDNRLVNGTAAEKSDTVAQRVNDLGVFIGRTATHELGHSLGLTDESNLHGCEGTHNCEAYDVSNPSDRFDNGHYIMDPGPKSTIWARIGVESSTTRNAQVPKFNSYNQSYLDIIHN